MEWPDLARLLDYFDFYPFYSNAVYFCGYFFGTYFINRWLICSS
jgi:hypothetical protein